MIFNKKINNKALPQQLKEILKRGFDQTSEKDFFCEAMFSYIKRDRSQIIPYQNKKFIVLEGLPGGGKTTLLGELKDTDIYTIDQILPFRPDDSKLTVSYIKKSDFLKTSRFLDSNESNVLTDRYYVSTLAYHWSYDKVFHANTYKNIYKWYKKSLKDGFLIKPFLTFLIVVSPSLSLERKNRINDLNSDNPWVRKDFLDFLNAYYKFFYAEIESKTRVIIIDGTLSLLKIKNIIKNEI